MIRAYSLAAGFFFVLPFAITVLFGPFSGFRILGAASIVLALLAPCYLVGYLLSPWAAKGVLVSKRPAFFMAGLSLLASLLGLTIYSVVAGGVALAPVIIAFCALFAVPVALVAALLFIGGCEQAQTTEPSP